MKIFLSSSREAERAMRRVSTWLPEGTARPWTTEGTFRPGYSTWDELLRIADTVDAAIIVLTEDDYATIRKERQRTARDNVWLEFGLFVGALQRENVLGVFVGKPRRATNLDGITLIEVPRVADPRTKAGKRALAAAKATIKKWAGGLEPRIPKVLTEIKQHLAPMQQREVATILQDDAAAFLKTKALKRISALCSNKGNFGKAYYGEQFTWVKRQPKQRLLRRVFVRMRDLQLKERAGFSDSELDGIRMHLQADCNKIQIRWVWEDVGLPDKGYDDSLGFALFGKKWLVHWGLKSGYCYQHPKDTVVAKMLSKHFNEIWAHAEPFNGEMLTRMFGATFANGRRSRRRSR